MNKTPNATKQICFRVTEEDHASLKALAEIAGVSMSAYLLKCSLKPEDAPDDTA